MGDRGPPGGIAVGQPSQWAAARRGPRRHPAAQTRTIYGRLQELLDHAGAVPADVVKTTDYITTHNSYRETAQIRREFFGDHLPASTGVIVSELFGQGVLIEIDAVVVL